MVQAPVQLSPSVSTQALSESELRLTDAYWRACHYLAVGMIYLRDNPLLKAATD